MKSLRDLGAPVKKYAVALGYKEQVVADGLNVLIVKGDDGEAAVSERPYKGRDVSFEAVFGRKTPRVGHLQLASDKVKREPPALVRRGLEVPEEPLHVIINFGMSPTFAPINFTGLADLLPATMRVDYVRIYQDDTGEMTCDPQDYPTVDYIAAYPVAYNNPNKTKWEDCGRAYQRPLNSLMDGCTAANYDGPPSTASAKRDTLLQPKKKRTVQNAKARNEARRKRESSWFSWS